MSLQFPRSCYSGDFPTVGGAVATSTGNACATANPTIAHEGQQYRRSSHGPHPGPRRQASGGSSRAARCGCQCITATRSNEPWSVPSMPAALNSAREEQLQSDRRNPPPGVSILSECGGGNINSGQRRNSRYRFLLRWPEFIFPPPHPSLKEIPPQGGFFYDQISRRISRGKRLAKFLSETRPIFYKRLPKKAALDHTHGHAHHAHTGNYLIIGSRAKVSHLQNF